MKILFVVGALFVGSLSFADDAADTYQCNVNYIKVNLQNGNVLQDQFSLTYSTEVKNPDGRNEKEFKGLLAKANLAVKVRINDMEHSCSKPTDCQKHPQWKNLYIATVYVSDPTNSNPRDESQTRYFSGGFMKGQMFFQNSIGGGEGAHANLICNKQ